MTAQFQLSPDGKVLELFIPMRFHRRGGRRRIIAPDGDNGLVAPKSHRDERMIQALARAHQWRRQLDRGEVKSLAEIAERENLGGTYAARVFDLCFLAPAIVEAILDGRQPAGLSLKEFAKGIPIAWEDQAARFGFGPPG